ncbi:MAG: hypothetical protein RL238_374 [Actinomycetota bacterium]|jgi:hypothetical protein
MSRGAVTFGVAAAVAWLLSACSPGNSAGADTSAVIDGTLTPSSTVTTSTAGDAEADNAFHRAIDEAGIDRATAPPLAVTLEGAAYCGSEDVTRDGLNAAVRQCFADALRERRTAVFVSVGLTNEGDPLAFVSRTDGGSTTFYFDHTRDPLSSGGWEVSSCDDLTVGTSPPPQQALVFACAV